MIKYKCKHCGSENIQGKAWVYLNDLCKNIKEGVIDSDDDEDFYCADCGEFGTPEIETDEEWLQEILNKE